MQIKVVKESASSTDAHLLVKSLSHSEVSDWDPSKIVNVLEDQCGLSGSDAWDIAKHVERDVRSQDKHEIDVPTLKQLVNYHLLMHGHNGAMLSGQVTLGMSPHDIDQLVHHKSDENSNVRSNSPETISMILAETTLKQFALKNVFSHEVSQAHLEGRVHIHDLGQINRVYCSAHSLRSIAMWGLGQYQNTDTYSTPAKSARVLIGHLNTFLSTMAKYYAGALGVDFVNVYLAPYVEHMSPAEMKQEAQYMIYQLSQTAFSRGGQVLFTDFNAHLSIPDFLKKVEAIGPGGKPTGRTYAEYESVAQDFLMQMLQVWREGDGHGMPFRFPKCDLHVTDKDFEGKAKEVLDFACLVASENGAPYFIFDTDELAVGACCRLRAKIDKDYIKTPEYSRFCGFQNVTINLPQCALRARGDLKVFYDELTKSTNIAVKAHLQRRKYAESIAKYPGDPLYEVLTKPYADGKPYINLDRSTYLMGIIGLTDAVKILTGADIHETEEANDLGLEIISTMYSQTEMLSSDLNLKFSLEESPAESAARRLAMVDLKQWPDEVVSVLNGSIEDDDVYYTNSIHLRPDAPVDFIRRITQQSEYHDMIPSGAIIHAFVGEHLPSPGSIFQLVKKTFENTSCAQLTISPEFTFCHDCKRRSNGVHETCPSCGSDNVDSITRVVGYYSSVPHWNKSKKRERLDRHLGQYMVYKDPLLVSAD